MNCESCNKIISIRYGSGRFCSQKCARSFSTSKDRKKVNSKISKSLSFGEEIRKCDFCKKSFRFRVCRKKSNCSRYCAYSSAKLKNTGKKRSLEIRLRHSKATSLSYVKGRGIYGGTTKWIAVSTSNGRIKVQGSYEVRACKILDAWKKLGKIKNWEYTKDRIGYLDLEGKAHLYHMDFKVFDLDGSFYYIETKGYKRLNDSSKWDTLRKQGHSLRVWFRRDLESEESLLKTY